MRRLQRRDSLVRFAVVVLLAISSVRPLAAQRVADISIGIRHTTSLAASRWLPAHPEVFGSYIPRDSPSAAPYVVIGALIGAATAGLWEARAISGNGDDAVGANGLLWIPPVVGALAGGFGGWLVFKIVHSSPATD